MSAKASLDLRLVLFAVALLIVAAVSASYLTFLFFSQGKPPAQAQVAAKEPPKFGQTFDLGDFTVNLSGDSGRRYVRAKIVVEVGKPEVVKDLEGRTPQLRDGVIAVLSAKTMDDISTPDGREQLRREIISSLEAKVGSGKIRNIYFTEFVYQ